MPRIRTIKPEFWSDEKLAPLTPVDRLVFLGLLSFADDGGRLVDNVKAIDGFIFPESEDTSRASLARLADNGRILRYTSDSGQPLIQIANWNRHQKIDHPAKYTLPAPSLTNSSGASRSSRETLAKSSRLDLGPSTSISTSTNDPRPATSSSDRGAAAGERACDSVVDQKKSGPDPTVVDAPVDAAIVLTSAANHGIAERFGEQPSLILGTASSTHEAVEEFQHVGVPIEFARDAIFTYCGVMKTSTPPRSLRYFVDHVKEQWAKSQARTAASQSDAQRLPEDIEDPWLRDLRRGMEIEIAKEAKELEVTMADVRDRLGPDLFQRANAFVERHAGWSALSWWTLILDLLKNGWAEPADIGPVCDNDFTLTYNSINMFRETVNRATRHRHASLNGDRG